MLVADPQSQGVSDALVNLRQFVGGLNTVLNDQSFAGTDSVAYNPTGQFAAVGPYGTSIEGQPITLAGNGAVTISPWLLLLGGLAAVLLLRGKA